ncbi:CpsD/CapB family tyrosine-protein kinase [Phenylobacterium sp.]|uniref:CpsD/CapB family tyrosine-protein kinase n=1 Tax=Phenylobacterium sp. TaxID=1871053 RepID=UPI001219C96F|nr:CpsD/CapB family tyrosine-protein kinase [Phenylobacterium sp.]THD65110.1 MAG: polysaccharide biosynthesis tyrosine autokinase [Phenylobacterium sp.]
MTQVAPKPIETSEGAAADRAAPRASERVMLAPALVTLSDPLSPGAEAIRALRTHVMAQHIQQGRRGLVICAASLDVGCSFVAANLAVALAQIGLKTLLVDGDLRSPSIHQLIPPRGQTAGLAGCLATAYAIVGDFIEEDLLPNLSVLYAGDGAANSQELLARELFEDVMNQCLRDYDVTIVDTPPANTSADARRICNVVGYALVVARRNKSLVSDVKTLVEQLIDDHAKVIGTVMNAE